jgi:putative ABC transport system permease protein
MKKNHFKVALRYLNQHKSLSTINIIGLSVGIAASLLIFIIVQFELSFDIFQPNFKNIYHVVTQQNTSQGIDYNPGVPFPTLDALRLDFPQAKFAVLNSNNGCQVKVPNQNGVSNSDKKFTENSGVVFTDSQYFDVFKSKWLYGEPSSLNEPNTVVIDENTAVKYFGDWKTAVGKLLMMDNLLTLKVAGIIETAPVNTDFPLKIMVSYITWKQQPKNYGYVNDWQSISSNYQVFMLLPVNNSVPIINEQLKKFSERHFTAKKTETNIQFLQPLSILHFDTRFGNTFGDRITSKSTLNTLTLIGILIIIMASINFINLSTAQSVGRSKEIGIRKVLGSNRQQLILQILRETTLIVVIAVTLAVFIAKIFLTYLKNIANIPDSVGLFNGGTLLFLICTTLIVVILSGLYPALIISNFKPVLALKNKITAASVGGISLRRTLVITQFSISQLLVIGTMVALGQMNFVNNADLGYNKDAILIIPGYTDSISLQKMQSFKHDLLKIPDVQSASFVSDPPSSDDNWGSEFYFNNSEKAFGFPAFLKIADNDYFKTFGLHFIAGRGYNPSDTMREVVVNETLIKQIGIRSPQEALGKLVRLGKNTAWSPITGVVKDFKTNSLREVIRPIIVTSRKKYESETAVKLNFKNISETIKKIQQLWEKTYPEYSYDGYFLDSKVAEYYKQENQLALIYTAFAVIAIFISCLGLYGLISFMTVQRTKEVGIRKVLGASVSSIVFSFSKEFIILISISFLIAAPVGWYFTNSWLQSFAYRISLNTEIFLSAFLTSILIASLTIGYKAVTAALVNPIKSLRSE